MIPYGKHHIDEEDINSVINVLKSNNLTQGPLIEIFEKEISNYVGAKYAIAVTSCTAGLHLASIASGLSKGKKLLTTPITFCSTANSSLFCGAKTVFGDIDSETINLSIGSIKNIIKTEKIDAISPVHFGGLPCDMESIKKISDDIGAVIYEDAAHAFGSTFADGSKVGSCKNSLMTVFSFHPVKSIATGEGGVITTNDRDTFLKLSRLRNHGIEKKTENFKYKKSSKSENITNPWYYEMQELGYHYRITDIQCALGISQLKKIDKFLKKRKEIAINYDLAFSDLKNCKPIQKNKRNNSSNHLYILDVSFESLGKNRATLMKEFFDAGITTQVHYIPVVMHPFYREIGYDLKNIPNSLKYYQGALSIPLYYDLTEEQQAYVIKQVKKLIG